MLAQHYTVTHHPLEVVLTRLTRDYQGVFEGAMARGRRELDGTGDYVDRVGRVSSGGIMVGALRRTPSGAVLPVHWWSSRESEYSCDFEGDLDVSPVVLDQTLLTLRGHASLHYSHPIGEAALSQVCALTLRAFLDGLSFATT